MCGTETGHEPTGIGSDVRHEMCMDLRGQCALCGTARGYGVLYRVWCTSRRNGCFLKGWCSETGYGGGRRRRSTSCT
eukprot:2261521-Rhodomonas_salina.2